MFVIYRKSDGKPFLQESPSSFFTKENYDLTPNYEHVANNHGGVLEDYDVVWIDAEITKKTLTHEFLIKNGEVIFGAEIVFPEPEPQPTTEIELLKQENEMLQMVMMEMTMYAATQDQRSVYVHLRNQY